MVGAGGARHIVVPPTMFSRRGSQPLDASATGRSAREATSSFW